MLHPSITTISFTHNKYEKSWRFTITLWNGWNNLKYIRWTPKINVCDYCWWNWSWLCFSVYIDKKGSEK